MNRPSKADQRTLRAEIGRKISQLALEAGHKAVVGAPTTDETAQIDTLQKIEAALPALPNKLFGAAIAIGILCVVAVSVAWSLRVWTTRVQVELLTSSISMQLSEELEWTGNWRFQPKRMRLEHFSHFDLPDQYEPAPALPPGSSLDLIAQAGEIHLTSLTIATGAMLTVASDQTSALDLVVRGAPFRGDIDVFGDVTLKAEPQPSAPFPMKSFIKTQPPGRFGFQFTSKTPDNNEKTPIPAVLHGTPISLPAFQEITVDRLGFFEERADGTQSSAFLSQIISGTLIMTDTGERIPLNEKAALRLSNASGLISSLKVTDKGLLVSFEGTASEVTLGTNAFKRNLKPRLLEWLFHQQKIGFLWTGITFLFGLFWSGRKLFDGTNKA